jgi:acyl-CoA thioester hydrolase
MGAATMSTVRAFTHSIRVPEGDIDRQGHVNNVAFLRYVQEVAVEHWLSVAAPELHKAYTWVVRRHEIEYLRPGLPDDDLVARTWVGEPLGATWERFTEIHRRGEDRPLVTARTVWVLLDVATGRPRRVDASFVACFNGETQLLPNSQS